jgi:hypothetical protein
MRIAGFVILSLMLAGVSFGQIKSGVIVGTVLDSGGAAVPGSTVTVINSETNVTLTAVTDENGSFTVPYLSAGPYAIEVEKAGSGFAKYRRPDITVSTAQTVKIEVKLQTGVISETVVVTGEAAQLQASNATVQGLVNERTVQVLWCSTKSQQLWNLHEFEHLRWTSARTGSEVQVLENV